MGAIHLSISRDILQLGRRREWPVQRGLAVRRGRNFNADHIGCDWTAAPVMMMMLVMIVQQCWRAAILLLLVPGCRRCRCRTGDGLVQQLTVNATWRINANPQRRENGRGRGIRGRHITRQMMRCGWQMARMCCAH